MTPEELKKLRIEHKLTQTDLAALIGRTVDTVRAWEGGRGNIDRFTERALVLMLKQYRQKEARRAAK